MPAETETKTPAAGAPRNAMSSAVTTEVAAPPPMEKLMTSTPSSVACSMAWKVGPVAEARTGTLPPI